jgi:hypothetical protein
VPWPFGALVGILTAGHHRRRERRQQRHEATGDRHDDHGAGRAGGGRCEIKRVAASARLSGVSQVKNLR